MGYGTRIKKLLKDKKISIKELAEQTGISLNTLYSITKRDSENVDFEILVKIALFLEIDITELIDSDSTHYMDYIELISEYDFKQNLRKKIFSNNLNYLIGYNHISLSSLSNDLNISADMISKWITGEVLPTQEERTLLENYFDLKENTLINEVILGMYEECPNNNDIELALLQSFERMGLNSQDIDNLKEYINFLKSKKDEDLKRIGNSISEIETNRSLKH